MSHHGALWWYDADTEQHPVAPEAQRATVQQYFRNDRVSVIGCVPSELCNFQRTLTVLSFKRLAKPLFIQIPSEIRRESE